MNLTKADHRRSWEERLEIFKEEDPLYTCFFLLGPSPESIKNFYISRNPIEPMILSQFPPTCHINNPSSILDICLFNEIAPDNGNENLEGFYSNIQTLETGVRVYYFVLKFREKHDQSKPECFPYALVLQSFIPLFQTSQKILIGLYNISKRSLQYPIEYYIAHLILQVPSPPHGRYKFQYIIENYSIEISLPPMNKLPVLDVNLAILFDILSIGDIISLLRLLAFEFSIVFVSQHEERLFNCSYSLLSLMYPLEWELIYTPVIGEKNLEKLGAPGSFVFGFHIKFIDEIRKINQEVTIVDLDNKKILKNDDGEIGTLPNFPENLVRELLESLQNNFASEVYRMAFFRFFTKILHESFSERNLIEKLEETSMFQNYFKNREDIKKIQQKSKFQFIDEQISNKDMTFVSDNSSEHSTTMKISVDSLHERNPEPNSREFLSFDMETVLYFPVPQKLELYVTEKKEIEPEWRTNEECVSIVWIKLWGYFFIHQTDYSKENIKDLSKVFSFLKESTKMPIISVYKYLVRLFSKNYPELALPVLTLMEKNKVAFDAETYELALVVESELKKKKKRNFDDKR